MKLFKGFFLAMLTLAAMTSCQKDDVKGIAGTWEGKWGFGPDSPNYYEKWELKKNGDMIAYDDDGDTYAEGNWHIDGENFEATYTTVNSHYTYSFGGIYDEVLDEITGNWGDSPSDLTSGTFEMFKD